MFRTNRIGTAALLFSLVAGPPALADQWLHVRVDDGGRGGEQISVNIPLAVVEAMLPMISVDELHHGHLQLDDIDLNGIDLREVLVALRDGPDAEYVTVKSEDESVRVAKEGEYLIVRVEERRSSDAERVHVKLPLAVVEALVGDDSQELDLVAGLRALGEFEGEDLVLVESDRETVRIWIDSSESGS